jgi:dynein intermediate chain 1
VSSSLSWLFFCCDRLDRLQCVKKARLTRIAFNPRYPILLVGDSTGNVSALKLSPNLRKPAAAAASKDSRDDKAGGAALKPEEAERQKLEQVAAVARRSQAPVL